MNSTTTEIINEFPKQMVAMFIDAIEKGTVMAFRIIWEAVTTIVFEHWLSILVIIFVLLAGAIIKYKVTGRWGTLASIIYRILYLSSLFVIGLVFGPDIFANPYFDIFLVFLYVGCFETVGYILRKTHIK